MKRKWTSSVGRFLPVYDDFLFEIPILIAFFFCRLTAEIEKCNAILASTKAKCKSKLAETDESMRKLTQEKVIATKKNKELVSLFSYIYHFLCSRKMLLSDFMIDTQEEKVESLEEELKDIEDLRQTVVSLMSKRKKAAKDKWHKNFSAPIQHLHERSKKSSFTV